MSYTYAHGSGTEEDPYQVWDADDLNGVRDHLDAYFIQMDNVDLGVPPYNENEGWVPIDGFKGVYDGGNKTISNLFIDRYILYHRDGLFGELVWETGTTAIFKNIHLRYINITARATVGSLIADCQIMDPPPTIDNCSVVGGVILVDRRCGGLIGSAQSGNINNCYVDNITISYRDDAAIEFGGIVGHVETYSGYPFEIKNCSFNGSIIPETIPSANTIGGIIGSYNEANNKLIYKCFCESGAYLEGDYGIGGIVGIIVDGGVSNCYSRCGVEGDRDIGGLVGMNLTSGLIENCYAAGLVLGHDAGEGGKVGGLVGSSTGTIINSYYDAEVSGQSDDDGRGTPKTTAEMTYPYSDPENVYIDWDFYGEAEEPVWQHDKEGLKYKKENVFWSEEESNIIKGPINDGYPHFIKAPQLKYRYMKAIRGGTVTPIS